MDNEDNINENNKKERSKLSLEGGKIPLSLYTRRVINPEKILDFLKEYSPKGICGTRNLGNSCYINSVLTSLINCQELVYYFLNGDYKKDISIMDPKILEEFNKLINQYWVQPTEIVIPEDFKDFMSEKYPQFNGFRQQDANEFLISTLNMLNESLKADNININNELILAQANESDEKNSQNFWNSYLKLNDSVITDLFCGQLKQTIICPECQKTKIKFECFNILNLPIPKNEKKYIYNFQFFYVPKYGIRRPVRIYYKKYWNEATFENCFEKLKEEDNFIYKNKINKLIINKTCNKKSDGFINEKTTLENCIKERIFYFCYDLPIGNKAIPIYMKKEGGVLSQYPRLLFFSEDENLDDFRLKLYYLIRKYIFSPLKSEDIEFDDLTIEIIKYIKDKKIEDETIINLINEEYKNSFKMDNLNENVKLFIDNLPFKILLVNKKNENDNIIFTSDFINLSEEIKRKAKINNFEDSIMSLNDVLKEYDFQIEFDPNSEYIHKYTFNLNISTRCICTYEEKENIKKLTLDDCFKNFIKEEKLREGEEWECTFCYKKVMAKKKIEFYYLPKIFVVCFTRFSKDNENIQKNQEEIDFKINDMDMKEYMLGPDKDHSKYDLFAIIQHIGTLENGHYTSICNNFGNWYKYNDSNVKEADINREDNSNAYILFYRRQTD